MTRHKFHASASDVKKDWEALKKAGYILSIKSPWHWHAKQKGGKVIMNIWPTVKKYMMDGSNGASKYGDVVREVSKEFAKRGGIIESPEVREAQMQLEEYRSDPFGFIERMKNKV